VLTPILLLNKMSSRNQQRTTKNRRSRPKRKSKSDRLAPVRMMIDGPTSDMIVRDIQFPLMETFGNNVVNVCTGYIISAFTSTSATLPTFATLSVTLAQFDKVSSYTGCFDQYRIRCVECNLIPGSTTGVSGGNEGLFASVIDYDDDTALTAVADALSYQTCLSTSAFTHHKRIYKPHIAAAVYSGAFTSFANESDVWLDAGSTGVKHYGLKTAATATTSIYVTDLAVRAWIQFRNGR